MQKQLIAMSMAVVLSVGLCAPVGASNTQAATSQPSVSEAALQDGVLQWSELESCVRNGNSNVLSCAEALTKLSLVDRESVVQTLKKTDNALTNAIWYYSQNGSDTSALQNQQNAIEKQIDDYSKENYTETYNGSVLMIQSSIHQIVKSSESLYFGILKLDFAMDSVQRNLDALSRSIRFMESRCRLGQASQEDLRTLQDQYTDVKSQLGALQAQSKISKQSLQSMIGITPDGSLQLETPSVTNEAGIAAINLSQDIAAGKEASAVLYQDQQAVDDAKDDLDDLSTSPMKQHNYQQAIDTLSAAKSNFEVQATALFQTLQENQRLYKVAQTDLNSAQKTYALLQKKHTLGIISKQDLLNAQDALSAAQQNVDQAILNLNIAYANYRWVRFGISGA